VNAFFLEYYLIHEKKYFEDVAVGATVKSLRMRHFEDLLVPLPSLPEQEKIVAKLDQAFAVIDEARAKTEQSLADTRELWECTFENMFRG
jgi:type I restriction enzyme S subunit